MKHISFVVPVFNEEANLREFYQRLTDIMSALPYEYDLTFVDDGSKDSSAVILAELVRNDERVQAYLLSTDISWHCPAGWIMLMVMLLLQWMEICSIRLN